MKLIIEGDKKYLDIILKDNRNRAIKYGLKMSIDKSKSKIQKDEPEIDTPLPKEATIVKKFIKKGK
jgi:hypothetical protein